MPIRQIRRYAALLNGETTLIDWKIDLYRERLGKK
jgi:hypothetical protein